MKKKTYRYFVSFVYFEANMARERHANTMLVYDEPLDTQDMIYKAERDIKRLIDMSDNGYVHILFFKRIKENRTEVK